MNIRGISVLGSTGTIGTFTLDIARQFSERFRVISLVAGKNIELLKKQVREFHPKLVSIQDASHLSALQHEFPETEFYSGTEGLHAAIQRVDVDVVVNGIVGFAGLQPALIAIRANKLIALANKESLVVAGSLVKEELSKSRATLIPVDSEHNALFQLLLGREMSSVDSLVLTASGGPFFKNKDLDLSSVTPEVAVKHPNWNMGPKISVDSATMMNKGLELIEAHYLFDVPEEKIEVWVHPQSIVHGAIWLKDNSCLAQLTKPDMKSSIGYALAYPHILPNVIERFSLKNYSHLEFLEPDGTRFPALSIARTALKAGPSHLVALNASNEIAVAAFLDKKIRFTQITDVVEKTLAKIQSQPLLDLESIFGLDLECRTIASETVSSL